MARLGGDRAGAGEEKEEKSIAVAVAVTVAPTSCHSFSAAFSLAIMAFASSSNGGVTAAPKGLVIRSVQILNNGLNGHESRRLLLLVRQVVSRATSLVFFF